MQLELKIIKSIDELTEQYRKDIERIAEEMYKNPELAFEERFAHDLIAEYFESFGEFKVTRHAYGVETAFEVLFENGGRFVNFNAELDALPDIGHGCGHNLIAASSCASFLGLVRTLQKFNLPGSVQLLGTPAEESLGGKCHLLKNGAYEKICASFMAHPLAMEEPDTIEVPSIFLAGNFTEYEYTGKPAHASAFPWDGINAMDACVGSWNNVSMLRQQIKPYDRIHGFFKDGPTVANVIPASGKAVYYVRSRTSKELDALSDKVGKCCEASSLATGCSLKLHEVFRYLDMIQVPSLIEESFQSCEMFANSKTAVRKVNTAAEKGIVGSSDIGNVSQVMPAIHLNFGIPLVEKCAQHTREFADSAGRISTAMPPTLVVAKANALTAYRVLQDDDFFAKIKAEHKKLISQ